MTKSVEELLAEAGDAYHEYYKAITQMKLKES
jgi:cellobiose-specific phosphotransferase system component IIA